MLLTVLGLPKLPHNANTNIKSSVRQHRSNGKFIAKLATSPQLRLVCSRMTLHDYPF